MGHVEKKYNPEIKGGFSLWKTKHYNARTVEPSLFLLLANKIFIRKKVLRTNHKDVLNAEGPES